MTTPERLRRRQRRETGLVIVTILLVVGSSILFDQRDAAQKQCQADAFADLSAALTVRSDLAERDSTNLNMVVTRVATATTREQVAKALRDFRIERAKIDAKRERTPIPPYPSGKCD